MQHRMRHCQFLNLHKKDDLLLWCRIRHLLVESYGGFKSKQVLLCALVCCSALLQCALRSRLLQCFVAVCVALSFVAVLCCTVRCGVLWHLAVERYGGYQRAKSASLALFALVLCSVLCSLLQCALQFVAVCFAVCCSVLCSLLRCALQCAASGFARRELQQIQRQCALEHACRSFSYLGTNTDCLNCTVFTSVAEA